jgi:DNA-directed DNA polymerase III PolC
MNASPHTHAESPLTGSTLGALVKRAKELGRTHFAYTDHGHLSSSLKAYNAAKKAGLKFIPGIEIYFKDNKCPITAGTPIDRCRYFTLTLYCHDQAAYQELCRVVSRKDFPTIDVYEERQQLWSWKDLESIAKFNVSVVLGGIHCIVGKAMLAGRADLAEMVLLHMKSIFPNKLYSSIICEPWLKKYSQVVEIKYVDGSRDSLLSNDQVTTDRARRIKAIDLVNKGGHTTIKAKYVSTTYFDVNKNIDSVKLHKGFLPLPGGDVTYKCNRFHKALSVKHNIPLLVTDYAYYANKEDKIVQTMRLEGNDKLQPNLHMKTKEEIVDYLVNVMGMAAFNAESLIDQNTAWAKQFDSFKLDYEWRLAEVEGSPIQKAMEIIKQNGRMRWDDPKWVARLKEELEVIAKNPKKDLTAYFLPIRDVLNFYKENGFLTGPGRGSAGGSLFCYLLGITQVDPFEYDLPFQRFFSLDRIMMGELPDIDVDLEDRVPLVGEDGLSGYLYGKYGDKAAQISTRTTIRLKSAIKDTNRYFNGKVEDSIETFTKGLPAPPQGVNDHQFVFGYEDTDGHHVPGLIEQSEQLKQYSESRPKEWEIVSKAMGITRAFSKHASAFVLSDVPIQDILPTKDGNVTQYEAKEVEAAKLIKYDFLVINQLKDIRVCLDLINKKNNEKNTVGYFPHNGNNTYVWALPKDEDVFKSVWDGSTETCFQINTRSMVPFVIDILPSSIMDLATILALVRPGPMDFIDPTTGRNMVEEYVMRKKGQSEPDIKELADLLPETFGIITFQEQLNKIARDLAGFPGPEAETLRKNMAKKKMVELMKMKPAFIEGAMKKVPKEVAEAIWDRMVTFGRYGFSVIHAVEYAHITYACMFLKYHYPLEWWAAVLTNAEEKEITGKFWPYVKDMVSPPDINLSGDTMVVDYANNKIRAKLGVIRGIGEATIKPIVENRPYKDIQDFVNKEVAGPSLAYKLTHVGVLDSLYPPKTPLLEKLKMYEDAVEVKKFQDKAKEAAAKGKKMRVLQPKEGQVSEGYTDLHPLQDAAMKKSVLPSLPIRLHDLGKKHSKLLVSKNPPTVISTRGYETKLIDGEMLERLDQIPGESVTEDRYIAATCFVVEAKEFSYAKNTKTALKLILDADGYVSEKVLWPDYESGQLNYPESLKKGVIATVFFRKKAGRKDMSITSVAVET